MNIIQELISFIESKSTWSKDELLMELLRLMAKHKGG